MLIGLLLRRLPSDGSGGEGSVVQKADSDELVIVATDVVLVEVVVVEILAVLRVPVLSLDVRLLLQVRIR